MDAYVESLGELVGGTDLHMSPVSAVSDVLLCAFLGFSLLAARGTKSEFVPYELGID